MTETNQVIEVIASGFDEGFSLKTIEGKVRRFGCCQYQTDDHYSVVMLEGKFFLIHHDCRDNGFGELGREELPSETLATYGYHDDEHGEWETLAAIVARKAGWKAEFEETVRPSMAAENVRSAAPELLAACELLMKAEGMQSGKRDGATMGQISLAIDAARAAITKATT